jgi:hypothetical protein
MDHHLPGPLWGHLVIVGFAGAITLACFVLMIRMLFRPGESDPTHPKHEILSDDS